jgi:hypothetical protein
MAILINDNYDLAANKPFDARYLNIDTPWTDIPAVLAGIPTYRYIGLTVNIAGVEYWWKDGVGDGDLVEKIFTGGGTITGATNGLHINGVNDKEVVLGGDLITGTTINGLGSHELDFINLSGFQVSTSGSTAQLMIEPAGITLAFSGQSVSFDSNAGLTYDGDYSSGFTAQSLVDANFVTGHTANNFLKLDQTIPQDVCNGQPFFHEGLIIHDTPLPSSLTGHTKGKLFYDNNFETLAVQIGDVDVSGNSVTLQIGQEELRYVYNASGAIIPNGTVVRSTGVGGSSSVTVAIGLAIASGATTAAVIGVTTQEIAINGYGFITTRGYVNDLNTLTNSQYSGMTVGDTLYLSPTIEGGITNVPPAAPNLRIVLGGLVIKDAVNGRIFIEIRSLYRLGDLGDVNIPSPSLDDVLKFNGLEWVNGTVGSISAGAGVDFYNATPVINSRTQPAGISQDGTAGNGVQIATLSKIPVTSGGTQYVCGAATLDTRAFIAWCYPNAIGKTVIESGTWTFTSYASVNSVLGGSITYGTRQIYQVVPISGSTVDISGSGNARTAIITSNQFTGSYFTGSTINTTASWLQIPSGVYQICAGINTNQVCIVVPTGFANSSGITGSTFWNKLFGVNTPTLTTSLTCYTGTIVQPAFVIGTADKLGQIGFATTDAATERYIVATYNGTTFASYFKSPLVTVHNDLAGLQGGNANERYHITCAQNQLVAGITASAVEINVLDGIPSTLTSVELGYVDDVTSPIQLQLDGKSGTGHTHSYTGSTILDKPTFVGSGATVVTNSGNTIIIYSSGGTGVEVFTDDILVSIAANKTFGKYENGDLIPASGKTPAEVIMMALIEALPPTVNLSSSSQNLTFGLSAKTVNLTFSYTINTQGATVDTVLLEWRRGNTGAWSGLTTNTGATTYNHTIYEANRFNTAVINYRYTVTDTAAASTTVTYDRTPLAYTAPSISLALNGTVVSPETQTVREKGNVISSPSGSTNATQSLVDITAWTLERRYNGGGWTVLASASGLETQTVTISSTLDNTVPTSATSIDYRIGYTDEYTSNYGSTSLITFKYFSFWGFNTSVTLTESDIEALANKNFLTDDNLTWNNINSPVSNYTYYAYPSTYPDFTSVIKNGVNQDFGSWQQLSQVSVTNTYLEALNYKVWRTNATQAYSSTDDIVIS